MIRKLTKEDIRKLKEKIKKSDNKDLILNWEAQIKNGEIEYINVYI